MSIEINAIVNTTERSLTVTTSNGNTVIPAWTEHRFSSPIEIAPNEDLTLLLSGTGLEKNQLTVFEGNGELQVTYDEPPSAFSLPDLSCNENGSKILFVLPRPTTNAQNISLTSVWVIGDIDTGGGK